MVQRKLTITISDEVYRGLHERIGRGGISRFVEGVIRPHVVEDEELETAYREMAADEEREREARDWIELSPDEGLKE